MHGNEKADLIIHPIRLRVMQLLGHKPLTTSELDAMMPDVAKSSLYRHLKKLLDGGFIEIAETHLVKGTEERAYRLLLSPHITQEDVQMMSKDDHLHYFSTYAAGLVQDFKAYLDSQDNLDMLADRAGYSEAVFYASTEEMDELFAPFRERLLALSKHLPQAGRRLRKLVFINHPEVEEK
ncbi:MAG: helix-turn-helix domain-containing protein [Anaerolineaceae bacterium]|nr:helix-turn-helix domain-containing protein [Anaerolineaceae bacterium]